ncbi:MAG TPA: hypothetical protein VH682_01755 [Gemmataceae bacterium]
MRAYLLGTFLVLVPLLFALGCANEAPPREKAQDKEAKIKAALDKLDPDDRELAEEQKYCAVETENRLGAMGKPVKVMIKDEPVFLCCAHCEKAAKKDPDKTLARVEELKSRTALEQLDPADRKLAEEQKYCAVQSESLLGSMGKPVKVTIKDETVFLCCKNCEKHARKEPDKTLATVKELKAANKGEAKEKKHE